MPHPEKTPEQQAYSTTTTVLHLVEATTHALRISPELSENQRTAIMDAVTRLWCVAATPGAKAAFATRVEA